MQARDSEPVIVNCAYYDDGPGAAELIREAFRIFLQAELGAAPGRDPWCS